MLIARTVVVGLLASTLLLIQAPASAQVRSSTRTLSLLVPAYFYPAGKGLAEWKRLMDSAAQAPIVAIVNPASGPGQRVDDNYSEVFRLAKTSKLTLIGYVPLGHGKRTLAAVRADVDRWVDFYPGVRGIFFDEQPSSEELAAFALNAFAYARTKIQGAVLVSNPGTRCSEAYLDGRNPPLVCLFENETGFDKYELPDWAGAYSPSRFGALIYHVKTDQEMLTAIREAVRKRTGFVYVTDAGLPNPWDRLPVYWTQEVEAVRLVNGGEVSGKAD